MQRQRRKRAAAMVAALERRQRTPGNASAKGRALRSAASTHAVRRDSRASTGIARGQPVPRELHRTAAAGAVELLAVPAGAARHGFPRDALRRIAALEFAQAREVGVVAATLAPANPLPP